jgi:hypothetical protein
MPVLSLVLWLLLLWALAPLAFPLSRRVWALAPGSAAGAWPDGGWAAGRMLALVLWTVAAFWAGHMRLPVRLGWVLLIPALAISALAWARQWPH